MTNAIGTGTGQITYNGPVDEGRLLGWIAEQKERVSRSELLRKAVEFFLVHHHPDEAQKLRAIRDSYRSGALLALMIASAIFGYDAAQRPRMSARQVRVVHVRTVGARKDTIA